MKKLFFLICGVILLMGSCFAEIVTSTSLEELMSVFDNLQEGDLLLVDIDDTLMTPQSKVFHQCGRSVHFIDELKTEKDKISNLPEILGRWRLDRKVQLVNSTWPSVLATLSQKGVIVLGLTQMETGPCGPIQSMEEWRVNELKKYGFTFTEKIANQPSFRLKEMPDGKYASFNRGIMMTGPFSKGEALAALLAHTKWRPKQIIFFDDRLHHVKDVESVAMALDIPYLGVHFKEVDKMLSTPDPRVIELQKKVLIEQGKWLEDEEAEKHLSQLGVEKNASQ